MLAVANKILGPLAAASKVLGTLAVPNKVLVQNLAVANNSSNSI